MFSKEGKHVAVSNWQKEIFKLNFGFCVLMKEDVGVEIHWLTLSWRVCFFVLSDFFFKIK